jgi:transposase
MFRISEKIWERIKILIPSKKSKIGRPRRDEKTILDGIFFVMHTGIQWKMLPGSYGAVSTVHGTFMRWVKEGTFQKILATSIDLAIEILAKPQSFHYDTSSQKSPFAHFSGHNPTDRKKQGVKKGIVIDFKKIILSLSFDPANVHDSKTLQPHLENTGLPQ